MGFKRIGSPAKVELIRFEGDTVTDVICHLCNTVVGKRSSGLFRATGSKATFAISGRTEVTCKGCKEKTYVL